MLRGTTVESYYAGACVYRGDGSLGYILHPEGVVRATGQGLSHEYFLKDHLANTRVVFNGNGAVLQATDYYAFGLEHTPKAKENENRYLFNGKEFQDETFAGGVRLGWYDYGARFYDPTIARWVTIDPLAEIARRWTPYQYAYNNPIRFIDPDGMKVGDPVKDPKIRANRASNLFGQVRTENGIPNSKNHQGFDYEATVGTNALAVKDGTIVDVGSGGDYGNSITIFFINDEGTTGYAFYAHMDKISLAIGDQVCEGQIVGTTGATGNADPNDPHLHFEYRTEQSPGKGLDGRDNPNTITDTKFVSQDATVTQINTGVQKITTNNLGEQTITNMNLDGSTENVCRDTSIPQRIEPITNITIR